MILSKDQEKLLLRAVTEWGIKSQLKMVHEECLELAIAIHKATSRVGGRSLDHKVDQIIDEIADVYTMIRQANVIFNEDKIQERIDFKMNRLRERLNKDS